LIGGGPLCRLAAVCLLVALCLPAAPCRADPPAAPAQTQVLTVPVPPPAPAPAPESSSWSRWLNPATAPFIPVPLIGVDPNSGTTLGLLPTWVATNEDHEIDRIIAPDVLHNPYFGYGMHARVYSYDSSDEQSSVIAGIQERVERQFDAEYQIGRLREQRWSATYSLDYNRDGTPRFYGVGNNSPAIDQTNYTNGQAQAQAQLGLNLTHTWQLQYTVRMLEDDVTPGTLERIATLESHFGRILGVGTTKELLNRLAIVYDTRDDLTVPSRGMLWVAYGGLASRGGAFNNSLFSESGVDGRGFWPLDANTVLASHVALRYLLSSHAVPFWALSGIGGGESVIGGEQPLRGFGAGRFYDRDSFSTSFELRHKALSFNADSTLVDVEVGPFVDLGRVFARNSTFPIDQLHQVYGVGFRGIARPFVVGYVDIGHGSEGFAVFTGLNYPF
jgi:hypothetical protein